MNYATHCKFCKKPITLQIDDDYARLGDPLKLIQLAACNRCADIKVAQRKFTKQLETLVAKVLAKPPATEMPAIRESLTRICKAYLRFCCEWNRVDYVQWDDAIVEQIIEHPETIGKVVGRMWKMARNQKPAELLTYETP